jgi:hypothetical protein
MIHPLRIPSRSITSSFPVLFHSRSANAQYGSKAYGLALLQRPFLLPDTSATIVAYRSFSSRAHNTHTHKNKQERPYSILGIPANSSYEEVKGTFVRLALLHHPDKNPGRKQHSVDEFVRYRKAFETIRARETKKHNVGKQYDEDDEDDDDDIAADWNDEEMQEWFKEETGQFLSFHMDHDTIQECIKAFSTLAPGGRDPGEWEMARQLTEREARRRAGDDDDDDDGPLLQLISGSRNSGTTIQRRQRRW